MIGSISAGCFVESGPRSFGEGTRAPLIYRKEGGHWPNLLEALNPAFGCGKHVPISAILVLDS